MSEAFCIACRQLDERDEMYHVEAHGVYIHPGCCTRQWADKLDLEIDGDAVMAVEKSQPAPAALLSTESEWTGLRRIFGALIMGVVALIAVVTHSTNGIVNIHLSIGLATAWLTGLAMVLR